LLGVDEERSMPYSGNEAATGWVALLAVDLIRSGQAAVVPNDTAAEMVMRELGLSAYEALDRLLVSAGGDPLSTT
jgi:hypothetical protein